MRLEEESNPTLLYRHDSEHVIGKTRTFWLTFLYLYERIARTEAITKAGHSLCFETPNFPPWYPAFG